MIERECGRIVNIGGSSADDIVEALTLLGRHSPDSRMVPGDEFDLPAGSSRQTLFKRGSKEAPKVERVKTKRGRGKTVKNLG